MPQPFVSIGRLCAVALSATVAVAGLALMAHAQEPAPGKPAATAPARYAGATEKGFLLPNGWTLSPAGAQIELTDLPLNIIPLADNRHALAASSGFNAHNLVLVDLASKSIAATETVRQSWFGLALDPKAGKIWWSGGGGDRLHTFDLKDGKLSRTSEPEAQPDAKGKARSKGHFKSGLTLSRDGAILYSLDMQAGTLTAAPAAEGLNAPTARTATVGQRPYDVVESRNGTRLYVSDWADRRVLAVDPSDLRVVARIPVGEHPNQIAVHPKDDRIFVACASSNNVAVIDTRRGTVTETIMTAL
ncbi:MAG: YncE family protein, partial [Isosphaeraceae bacterium]